MKYSWNARLFCVTTLLPLGDSFVDPAVFLAMREYYTETVDLEANANVIQRLKCLHDDEDFPHRRSVQ
jgi:hypothetical protein